MGGNVSVKSKVGKGTVFKIELTTICNVSGQGTNSGLGSSSVRDLINQSETTSIDFEIEKNKKALL
jgi:hypothetical protein